MVPARAAVLLGHGQAEEPDLAELADDRPVDLLGPVPVAHVGHDLTVDEVPRQLTQGGLLIAERQIHASDHT